MKRFSLLTIGVSILLAAFACASGANDMVPAETIARIMTSAQIFQVTPTNVGEALKDIVRLESKGPGKYLYKFSGKDPARGVVWAVAEFQPDETGRNWPLLQIRLGLKTTDASGKKTYTALHQAIKKRLGKPEWSGGEEYHNQIGWTVGQENGVVLKKGKFENPIADGSAHLVVLEAAVFQGEPEG